MYIHIQHIHGIYYTSTIFALFDFIPYCFFGISLTFGQSGFPRAVWTKCQVRGSPCPCNEVEAFIDQSRWHLEGNQTADLPCINLTPQILKQPGEQRYLAYRMHSSLALRNGLCRVSFCGHFRRDLQSFLASHETSKNM